MALTFKPTLMPHQTEAKVWCLKKEKGGCLLALVMGAGKSIVSLAVMVERPMKTLLVLPLSLLAQWEAEITTHTTGFTVAVHHGVKRMSKENQEKMQNADVVLTTYNTIWSDYKNQRPEIYDTFERVIIDEAHKLRERKSKMHIAVSEVFSDVEHKILLTGTPIANGMQDLISMFYLMNHTPYNDPKHWSGMTLEDKAEQVLELRKDYVLYKTAEETIADKLPQISIMNSSMGFQNPTNSGIYDNVLNGHIPTDYLIQKIIKLRQCANDVKLLKDENIANEISDKLAMTKEIIKNLPAGEKVVIFSQWLGMLEILHDNIEEKSVIYHGNLKKEDKNALINAFKTDDSIRIMYITLKAGSVGLNLTVANHAIICEPYFNAAEENQAISRVFRIGQTKHVMVHKLQISNSVESWLKQLQKVKSKMTDLILNDIGNVKELQEDVADKKSMFDQFINNIAPKEE